MRIAAAFFVFLNLASLASGQAYKVTREGLKPSPETPTISVPSPAAATSSMASAAASNVARQQAVSLPQEGRRAETIGTPPRRFGAR